MPSELNRDSPQTAPNPTANSEAHTNPVRAFWQILTHFDSAKVSPHRALRNAIGVVLPLIVGFVLQMPRGGLVMASGALNVSYSDGSDPYALRARRMLASSILCAFAVFAGAISSKHQIIAIVLATVCAFIAGMFVAVGGAAPDLGMISLVTLLIYAAQPLTPHQAALSGLLALAGGLLQTILSVFLWPVRRHDPERRVLATFYRELAGRAVAAFTPMSTLLASVQSDQAQETLLGLGRDEGAESMRYRSLLSQGERIRLSLLMLSRLRLRMEKEKKDYRGIQIIRRYLELAPLVLGEIAGSLESSAGARQAKLDVEIFTTLEQLADELRAQEAGAPPSFLAAVVKDAVFQMDAVSGQLRAALDLVRNSAPQEVADDVFQPLARLTWRETVGNWVATLRGNLNLQSSAFRHALRLAALVALGDILGRMVSWRRTYWLPMTIVLVLKPEFTATFTRGLLRIAGTVVGPLLH